MRNKFVVSRFLEVVLLSLLLCMMACLSAPARAADDHKADDTASANSAPHGTLYKVSYHGHTTYLFGTIHVGKPAFFPLEKQATQALAAASTLALEIDLRDMQSLKSGIEKYGMYTGNDTLDKHLTAATLARLKQALATSGIPYENVVHMKAWMVADLLLVSSLEQQGYQSALATDSFLLKTAVAQNKTIQGLETADFQFSLFDHLSAKEQEDYLNDNLDDMQSGAILKETEELVNDWLHADSKGFEALLAEAQENKTTAGTFLTKVLLDQRNPVMASKIETLLKRDKNSFVGIGLLHLIGPNGVPQLLSRHGYEVTRLY